MPYTHLVDGDTRVHLRQMDAGDTAGLTRDEAQVRIDALGAEMRELGDLLFYAGRHGLLVIFQGLDASGKDGATRSILSYSVAQNLRVEAFKVPTPEERAHDFLWRIHQRVPGRGTMTIFNRSHYEDVVVPRVHGEITEKECRRRYLHIRDFEELLADSGTIIVKLFLLVSKEEQERRLLDREKQTHKAWKLSVSDWKDREHWDDYLQAYEDALNACGTPRLPWHVVSADRKWFRNLAVVERITEALRPYREEWMESLRQTGERAMAEIRAFREGSEGAR